MKNKAQQMADNMPDADMGFHAEAKMDAENRQDDAGKSYKSVLTSALVIRS